MAQGKKKLKINPTTGELDSIIDNDGVFIPFEGVDRDLEDEVTFTQIEVEASGATLLITAPNHGLADNDTIEIAGLTIPGANPSVYVTSNVLFGNNQVILQNSTFEDYPLVGESVTLSGFTTYPVLNDTFIVESNDGTFVVLTVDSAGLGIPTTGSITDNVYITLIEHDISETLNGRYYIFDVPTTDTIRISHPLALTTNYFIKSILDAGLPYILPNPTKIYKFLKSNEITISSIASFSGGELTLNIVNNSGHLLEKGDFVYIPIQTLVNLHWGSLNTPYGIREVLEVTNGGLTIKVPQLSSDDGVFVGLNITRYANEEGINGQLKYKVDPRTLRDYNELCALPQVAMDEHLAATNPHSIGAFDVGLDQLTNNKQIPIVGTVNVFTLGVDIFCTGIIQQNPTTYRFYFTTSPTASGLVNGETFSVSETGGAWDADDWVVTSGETFIGQYYFDATSPSVTGVGSFGTYSTFAYGAFGGSNNINEVIPGESVSGNVNFAADPATYNGWGTLSVAHKGYVDDAVAYTQTVSSTSNTLVAIPTSQTITENTTTSFKATLIGRCTGGTSGTVGNMYHYELTGTVKNIGGSLTLGGVTGEVHTEEDALFSDATTGTPITIGVTGTTLDYSVTGATNINIDWKIETKFTEV